MVNLIGTDEAGYGPNLGPLTICATQWSVAENVANTDLFELLEDSVSKSVQAGKLQIADSKTVHKSGCISRLEVNTLALLLACTNTLPTSWEELTNLLGIDVKNLDLPFRSARFSLPLAADVNEIVKLSDRFSENCARQGVRFEQVSLAAVFPAEFNEFVERLGNKAEVLSKKTLGLIENLLQTLDGPVWVICDKHGGRSKYTGMINQYLTGEFVRIETESLELSKYHWRDNGCDVSLSFRARGEAFLPTAVSSMVAKYIREVSMEMWNQFWVTRVPGIQPTKGYPVDAKRFKNEIRDSQLQLGILDHQIWRVK